MNRQENRIAVAAEIECLIEEIYERLDCIRELLWEVDDSLANRAERYWLAHIDGALFNRSGVLGDSFITAADTLEELEEGEKGMKIYGYLRVSTIDQDTEKNKADILSFANSKGFLGQVEFVEEKVSGLKSWKKRKLKDLVESMSEGDILIVPELSRLGRSLVEVLEVLNELKDKGVKVFSVKENFQLNGDDIQSKVMRTLLGLFAEIERDLISARTKEGLAAVKASGKRLGRPKGPGKSKLDEHKEEIIALLKNGSKKVFIAERYGVTPATLTNWLKRHGLDKLTPTP